MLVGATGVWSASRPTTSDRTVVTVLWFGFGLIATLAVAVIATRSRRVHWVAIPLLTTVLFGSLVVGAESARWQLARSDFDDVVAGARTDCEGGCTIGPWTATGVDRLDSVVVLWTETVWCDAGEGLAFSTHATNDVGAIRLHLVEPLGATTSVEIRPWRDDWFEICATTS